MPTETAQKVSFKIGGCELDCWWKSPYGKLWIQEHELGPNSFQNFWSSGDSDYKTTFSLTGEKVRQITLDICSYTSSNQDFYMIYNLS